MLKKDLLEFDPHVIVSLSADEFVRDVLPALDLVDATPPFYVLSPLNTFSPELSNQVATSTKGLRTRIVGVNFASAEDPTLYNEYIHRFEKRFVDAQNHEHIENYYDSAYYLIYAHAAAGNVGQYSGSDLERGIKRLLDVDATRFDVGPQPLAGALTSLAQSSTGRVALYGTTGAPEFDEANGARKGTGSVWCVDEQTAIVHDALRYDPDTKLLTGDLPCFAF
jgi:hypothetical protein